MNALTVFRLKNRVQGWIAPEVTAQQCANLLLKPRNQPAKEWELASEQECQRINITDQISAAIWNSEGEKKILIMHGWESRASLMSDMARRLSSMGFQVIVLDAPKHGLSLGEKSNVLTFADAIDQAIECLGPMDGTIAHSMGGIASSVAIERGLPLGRLVLLSCPARMDFVLWASTSFMGLSNAVANRCIQKVESQVGRPAKELNVASLLASNQPDVLLMHCKSDLEIPFSDMNYIHKHYPKAETMTLDGLGHRKIIRSPQVASIAGEFIRSGQVM